MLCIQCASVALKRFYLFKKLYLNSGPQPPPPPPDMGCAPDSCLSNLTYGPNQECPILDIFCHWDAIIGHVLTWLTSLSEIFLGGIVYDVLVVHLAWN